MRANIQKVLQAFAQGRAAVGDSKQTCSTDGRTVFSYRLPIARQDSQGRVHVLSKRHSPSRTTNAQIKACFEFFLGTLEVDRLPE